MTSAPTKMPSKQKPLGSPIEGGRRAIIGQLAAFVAAAVIPLVIVFYLGFRGGGYEAVVRGELGMAVWLFVAAFTLAGLLPITRPTRSAWILLGILASFGLWTGLAIIWSESAERTAIELARVATLLGIFVLGLSVQSGQLAFRRMLGGITVAIVLLSLVALASRFQPNWFPANEVAEVLPSEVDRLNYPLTYWNGLATLVAMGIPLLIWFAGSARHLFTRALAVAVIPALLLTVYYTLSRGGLAEIAIGVVALAALHPRRLQLLAPVAVAALGSFVLVEAGSAREQLANGILDPTAETQGDEMMLITLAVVLVAGLAGFATQLLIRRELVALPSPPAGLSRRITLGLGGVLAVAAIVAGVPGEVSNGWEEFKQPITPGGGTARLESASGSGRYQWWDSAVEANASEPILGIGPGTWEYWWARGDGGIPGYVRDAHSLYLESLGELGIPGLVLVVGLIFGPIGVGLRRALSSRGEVEPTATMAAAVAACATFAAAAAVDWAWELTVLPAVFLLIGAGVLQSSRSPEGGGKDAAGPGLPKTLIALPLLSLVALAAIIPPTSSVSSIEASKTAVDEGDLTDALVSAREADDLLPFSAEAKLQQALVLQLRSQLGRAAAAATEATEREPTNWRNWAALAEIQLERGLTLEGDAALARARELNPRSVVLAG